MTLPTADMEELLSLLNRVGCFEELTASWPRISALTKKLADIEGRLKRPLFRRSRPRRDERDGSSVPGTVEMKLSFPAELYEFHAKVRSIVFYDPVFRDPRAEEMLSRLERFGVKIHDDLQEGLR